MFSVFVDYLWLGLPSIEREVKLLNKFISELNQIRDDLYFTIMIPNDNRFLADLLQYENIQYVNSEDKALSNQNNFESTINIYRGVNKSNYLTSDLSIFTNHALNSKNNSNQKSIPALHQSKYDCDIVISFNPLTSSRLETYFINQTNNNPIFINFWQNKLFNMMDIDKSLIWDKMFQIFVNNNMRHVFENQSLLLQWINKCLKSEYLIKSSPHELGQGLINTHLSTRWSDEFNKLLNIFIIPSLNKYVSGSKKQAYDKIKKYVKLNGFVTKFELMQFMNWKSSNKFQPYRNQLRLDDDIMLIGSGNYKYLK